MSEKKTTVGQKFLKLLNDVSKNKDQLLNLACAVIQKSPSHRALKDRNLPDDATAIKMIASVAKFNASAGKDVSTDSMLSMIIDTYRTEGFGEPKKFKNDFKEKFPKEYAGKSKQLTDSVSHLVTETAKPQSGIQI